MIEIIAAYMMQLAAVAYIAFILSPFLYGIDILFDGDIGLTKYGKLLMTVILVGFIGAKCLNPQLAPISQFNKLFTSERK